MDTWSRNASFLRDLLPEKIHGRYIPAFIEELTGKYTAERDDEESFTDYVARLGKAEIKQILSKYDKIPTYEEAPGILC